MNWYTAQLRYQIITGSGKHIPQFEVQLRLIQAEDEQVACEKAKALGRQEESSSINDSGKLVSWQFIGLTDLELLENLVDGQVLQSRLEENEQADVYIRELHKSIELLQNRLQSPILQAC